MIENALVFVLGALSAGLLALALFPAFTRRARRLAWAEAEARLPRSLDEMIAAKDAVRAVYAAQLARREMELQDVEETLVAARNASAHDQVQAAAARAERSAAVAALQDAEQRLAAAHEDLRQREEAMARASATIRELERRLAAETKRLAEAEALVVDLTEALDDGQARATAAAAPSAQVPDAGLPAGVPARLVPGRREPTFAPSATRHPDLAATLEALRAHRPSPGRAARPGSLAEPASLSPAPVSLPAPDLALPDPASSPAPSAFAPARTPDGDAAPSEMLPPDARAGALAASAGLLPAPAETRSATANGHAPATASALAPPLALPIASVGDGPGEDVQTLIPIQEIAARIRQTRARLASQRDYLAADADD